MTGPAKAVIDETFPYYAGIPVGRLPTADDPAKLITSLASGPTASLTGDLIKIDGGALMSAGV